MRSDQRTSIVSKYFTEVFMNPLAVDLFIEAHNNFFNFFEGAS